MVSSTPPPHVVIFPFMAQGHTLPLLDLSMALSRRHVHVTVVTTPANAPSVSTYLSDNDDISIAEIPFPSGGCENTSHLPSMDSHHYVPFLLATRQLRRPFEDLLSRMSPLPIFVVSDFFLGWTLASCRRFGVPRLVFHGMGVASMAISKAVFVHAPHNKTLSDADPLDIPGLEYLPFAITAGDLPELLLSAMGEGKGGDDDDYFGFMQEVGEGDVNSWGVLVNSFWDLEGAHVPSFESFYASGAKAWCVGPLCLYQNNNNTPKSKGSVVVEWLTALDTSDDVIYVAFGTQVDLSDAQMDEVAYGLEHSGFRFVLVARSRTWLVGEGMEERVKSGGKGLIIREWVDQREILSHKAIGGFMSHCGWNSVVESLSAGVPILAWPMMAEQSLNAIYVAQGVGAGLRMVERVVKSGVVISRERICEGVRELMGGEKGRKARDRAQQLGLMATKAVQQEGSSTQTLNQLIAQFSNSST